MKSLGLADTPRKLLCKATTSLMVKRCGVESLEHKTNIFRGTEGEVRLCESWVAADDDDEGW